MQRLFQATMAILVIATLFSCSKKSSDDFPKARLTAHLTDAPASYDEINVDILQIGAYIEGDWYDFNIPEPGVYNLLDLANGHTLLVIDQEDVPAGKMSQMRLVLGENNTIMVDGEIFPLKTPSGQSSGYKIQIHADMVEDEDYVVMLDFDAYRSIVETGNNTYILGPVVNGFLVSEIGQISGCVTPAENAVMVTATNGIESYNTPVTAEGSFLFFLPPGFYDLVFEAVNPANSVTIENVEVLDGEVTFVPGEEGCVSIE